MSSDSSFSRSEPTPAVKPAVLGYGTVKTAGASIDIRIMKGRQNLGGLGLKVGEDVLVVAAPSEGILLVRLPKVVTGSTIPQILDRMKIAIDKLAASYQYTVIHQEQLFRLLARPRTWAKKVRVLSKKPRSKPS
ncbi:MAG: hypothetical protein WCC94_11550 [Candidatus Bathyarchaeia archaeon]